MALSRQQTKEWIFDYIAGHFEKTGELISITADEISDKTNTRIKRVKSLLKEMIAEGVLYIHNETQYRFTPNLFDEIADNLGRHNRLPDGFDPEKDRPAFPEAPSSYREFMSHVEQSIEKQTRAFDQSLALALMEQLGEAKDNGDTNEFNRIRDELESMGCSVVMKPDDTFSVFFPPEMF